MTRPALCLSAIVAGALFAFYLPSSVAGVISRPLSILSIGGTCAFLLAILVWSGRVAPVLNVATALSVGLVLVVFTVTSPFESYSLGVAMLYAAQALLFSLDLRGLTSPRLERVFHGITLVSLALGYALVLNVGVVDRLLVAWYGAFYPELLSNMVVVFNKPVLTFATHSMAGLMIYLFFYMHFRAWMTRGGRWHLAAAVAFLGLLVGLISTTGLAFAVVAALQLVLAVERAYPRQRLLLAIAILLAALAGATARGLTVDALLTRAEEAIVGDRVRGLFSRYAADGLLASNMKYLSESPLSPIGVGATDTLYLGDSGIVVNLLRGSVPLLLAVYGGLWLFLSTNLSDRRSAAWLWICVVLFEIGFTPLQYFRFLGFMPFLVVYLNSLHPPAPAGDRSLGARTAPR